MGASTMVKFILCGIILGILLKLLSNALNNLDDAIKKKETQRRNEEFKQWQEELRQQDNKEQKELQEALRQREIKEGRISYRNLYKGANTLKGNCYNFTAQVVQIVSENIYHVIMYHCRTSLGRTYTNFYYRYSK